MNRRGFITGLAASAGLIALPPPIRRYWAVPLNAPVGVDASYERRIQLVKFLGTARPVDCVHSFRDPSGRAYNTQEEWDGLNKLLREDHGRPTDMFVSRETYEDFMHSILNERPKGILSVKSALPAGAVESIEASMRKILYSSDFKPFRFTG